MAAPLLLRVHRAPEGSTLQRGLAFAVPGAVAVVGRAPDADVVLSDPTVSRHHLRIEVGPPLQISALTESNGTFLAGTQLEPHQPVRIGEEEVRLQLGGVVVVLVRVGETVPVVEPLIESHNGPPIDPALEVRWDAGQCVIRCGGRDLGLTGAAARFLGSLADQPGQVVHHWDLQEELSTPHLAPLATAARNALVNAVQARALDKGLLCDRVREAAVAEDADLEDLGALMRAVLQSRRGHGYVLHLDADDIAVVRV